MNLFQRHVGIALTERKTIMDRREFLARTGQLGTLAFGLSSPWSASRILGQTGHKNRSKPLPGRCGCPRGTRGTSAMQAAERCCWWVPTRGTAWSTWAAATRPRRLISMPTWTSSAATGTTSSGSGPGIRQPGTRGPTGGWARISSIMPLRCRGCGPDRAWPWTANPSST